MYRLNISYKSFYNTLKYILLYESHPNAPSTHSEPGGKQWQHSIRGWRNSVLWQNGKQLSEIRINDTTTTCLVIIVSVNDILETSGDVHACSSFVKYKLCTIIISQKSHAPDSKHEVSFSIVYYHMSREYVTYAILFLTEGDCADAIRIMRWYIGLDLDKCSTFDSYLFHTKWYFFN